MKFMLGPNLLCERCHREHFASAAAWMIPPDDLAHLRKRARLNPDWVREHKDLNVIMRDIDMNGLLAVHGCPCAQGSFPQRVGGTDPTKK